MKFPRILLTFMVTVFLAGCQAEQPTPVESTPSTKADATAILAGGCFWCVEHDLRELEGVVDVVSGYSGGDRPDPTYKNYNKPSGEYKIPHVEVVEVSYDSSRVSYTQLLQYFYRHIDPLDGGGQFCDRGVAYKPVVYVADAQERELADQVAAEIAEALGQPLQVEILDRKPFWRAEEYHQRYSQKNPKRYKYYRWNCGRDQRIQQLWGR